MKSVVNEIQPAERVYPYLARAPSDGLVVLFRAPGTGMVVFKGASSYYTIGNYMKVWLESAFSPLVGSVTLSND